MDAESIAGYGKLRLAEYDAANDAGNILDSSITSKERMRRLELLSEEQITGYTLALMDEHSQRMHAFRDAPEDAVFAAPEDRSSGNGDHTFQLRSMDVPEIGKLSLRIIAGTEAEVLASTFDHGGDNYVTHNRLFITGQREASVPAEVGAGSPFQAADRWGTVEMGSVSEDSYIKLYELAALEERVETLRAISEGAGIEITPVEAPEPIPLHIPRP